MDASNGVISTSKDNPAKLRRSKRDLKEWAETAKTVYRWLRRSKRLTKVVIKKGYRSSRRLIQHIYKEHRRDIIEELHDWAMDFADPSNEESEWVREIFEEGFSWLQDLVDEPDTSEDWIERIFDIVDAFDPFTYVDFFLDWEEGKVTQVPRVTDRQQVTTEVQQVTGVLQVTEEQQVTEITYTTAGQPVATEVQPVTERPKVTVTEDYSNMSLHLAAEQGNLKAVKYFVENVRTKKRIKKILNAQSDDGERNTPLHLAARNGHLDVVKYLVDKGVDVSIKNYFDSTPLHLTAQNGHLDIVKYLVDKGVDVRIKNYIGSTPLHFAAQNGHLDVVKYLVDKGVDVSIMNSDRTTPLQLSAQNGHLDTVKYFIERGAEFTSSDNYSKTALFYAAETGNLDLVKYLIEKGASINSDQRGDRVSALPYAAGTGNLDLVKYLVEKGADIQDKDSSRYTSLHRAALNGKLDVVKYFVEKGAYVNVEGGYFDRTTPLYDAAKNGHLDVAIYLITNGADTRSGGYATILLAVQKGDLDLVKYLVQKEVRIGGNEILRTAIEGGNFEIVKFLIDKGADITSKDYETGYTVLHQAAGKGSLDLVRYLVEEQGMAVNIETRYKTFLHLAVESGNLDLVKYLVEKGAHINAYYWAGTPLHTAVSKGNLEIVKYLLSAGADVNIKNGEGKTPLHLAAKIGNLDIVKYLIENGADSEATDKDGNTPLDRAAEDCHVDTIEYLQKKGHATEVNEGGEISVDESLGESGDKVGYSTQEGQHAITPATCEDSLYLALERGYLDSVRCHIEKGVDVNAEFESGFSLLHVAAMHNFQHLNLNVVKYLVDKGADVNARSGTAPSSIYRSLGDGVGIDKKPQTGRTPLHYAVLHGSTSFKVVNGRIEGGCLSGNLPVVKYLFEKGADVLAEDDNGKTPWDLLRHRCNPEVEEFLSHWRCGRRVRLRRHLAASNSLMTKNGNIRLRRHLATRNSLMAKNGNVRLRRHLATSNSPMAKNGNVHWTKRSTWPALLISAGHDNTNSNLTAVAPEINTDVVNNTIVLGILAAGLFNKTKHTRPIHENLLSPREQSMMINNVDEDMIIRAIQKCEEKFEDPKQTGRK